MEEGVSEGGGVELVSEDKGAVVSVEGGVAV